MLRLAAILCVVTKRIAGFSQLRLPVAKCQFPAGAISLISKKSPQYRIRNNPEKPKGAAIRDAPPCCLALKFRNRYRRAPFAAGSVAFLVAATFFPLLALQSW
jgi:hypothetical protein